MKKVLVTGGTVFVSKYIASYFSNKYKVYVLNRGNHSQIKNVHLIKADRINLENILKDYAFDVILDVNAYNSDDIKNLIQNLSSFKNYIMISSSAVYKNNSINIFNEKSELGFNSIWKDYGLGKLNAERELLKRFPKANIIRPPYLYGPMNNVYREAFVFDCALKERKFYLPKKGNLKLQFFYIEDLCTVIEKMIEIECESKIINVGNKKIISALDWAKLCYKVCDKKFIPVFVNKDIEQKLYFPFYDYEYELETELQDSYITNITDIEIGLKKSFEWYLTHKDDVKKHNYINYIDNEGHL